MNKKVTYEEVEVFKNEDTEKEEEISTLCNRMSLFLNELKEEVVELDTTIQETTFDDNNNFENAKTVFEATETSIILEKDYLSFRDNTRKYNNINYDLSCIKNCVLYIDKTQKEDVEQKQGYIQFLYKEKITDVTIFT